MFMAKFYFLSIIFPWKGTTCIYCYLVNYILKMHSPVLFHQVNKICCFSLIYILQFENLHVFNPCSSFEVEVQYLVHSYIPCWDQELINSGSQQLSKLNLLMMAVYFISSVLRWNITQQSSKGCVQRYFKIQLHPTKIR